MSLAWKPIRHRFELAGVRFLMALPRLLPYRWAVKAGGTFGLLAFDLFRIRRRVALENLDRAFGGAYTRAEKARIGRRSYVNFAKSMVEFASLDRLSKDDRRRIVRFEGLEHIRGAIEDGHGVILLSGHFGSWELLVTSFIVHDFEVDLLVGEQTNSLVNDTINDIRRKTGAGIIERGMASRGVFEALRERRVVPLLADQDARKFGIFVDFFGTPASTLTGPAQFAVRTGCPIVCSYIVRRADETHDAYVLPPLYARAGARREAEIRRLTEESTAILEEYIRRHPDHYFWAHRRWKTKPR
ncbi:MAG: hypothetical protein C4574_01255 [Candidatus Latescibacterota bacterium]|jgi:KDO2-lipid IV(A) lauroyltransferase|nr:MAG: hypothetical protein C4574_01255 [Candidatus Latescibacterota bacterium]